ncbi:sulfotransferase domain-containing protein [Alkalihalobacillus hemicellulosilyticus]|uniref:Putative deacetylase sulfotransferase n=1 Tax=Halalkalibacter hemicellulosilyticusJCM 9152 TaxID=1236971 RepID=W4QH25_9BACI|nr:sulfotransferase domain-containing protein [Halalkalibacter hemicellulosilyticus]GAE30928.1 putative deacetylase sulfotransferase [Halalkalibacter hemicellulosilyticusJCM 9152]
MASPSFLIIGAQKCGTTSLYQYLIKHPTISQAKRKEIHYFDVYYDKGTEWYEQQFSPLPKGHITGEATPRYLFHSKCPQRVYQYNPNMKLILLLRDPIDRAFSNYQMDIRNKSEKLKKKHSSSFLSFEETLNTKKGNNYLLKGLYYSQLKQWLRYFPLHQFHIIESNDFYQKTSEMMNLTFHFLGVKQTDSISYKVYHQGSYAPLNPSVRKKLSYYFKPYNEKLYQLIKRRFDWS